MHIHIYIYIYIYTYYTHYCIMCVYGYLFAFAAPLNLRLSHWCDVSGLRGAGVSVWCVPERLNMNESPNMVSDWPV